MKKMMLGVVTAMLAATVFADYVPLANTVRKLKSGSLRVAVVGDSLGWGQGAGTYWMQGVPYGMRVTMNGAGMPKGNPMGFARTFTDYVKTVAKDKYNVADSKIETFYSVWGGATTETSFSYFTQDILARRPDLMLIEIWNPCQEELRYAEAILRELWSVSPETDVILLSLGGCFSKSAVHKPLIEKYGVPFVSGYAGVDEHFSQFGKMHSGLYTFNPDGKVEGTRVYFFGESYPHMNEEGYLWMNDNLIRDVVALFEKAASASGKCERVAPAGALEGDPIPAKGEFMGSAAVISPMKLVAAKAVDAAQWKATVDEVADEPRDTADRATGDRLTALADGATIAVEVSGRKMQFRGNANMSVSFDGGKTFAPAKGFMKLPAEGDKDFTGKIVLKADKKGAWFNEFYVFSAARNIPELQPTKHRWSVKYFARVAELHYHDWELNGKRVIPHALSWLNVFRDETYSKPLKVAEAKIISSECAANGTFLGWVEPDEIKWVGSERQMVVKSFEGKKIYKPGEELDMVKIGRDLTLVAAYSDGPLSAQCERTIKATFMMGPNSGAKRVALLDAPAKNPVITLPELPKRPYYVAKGWKAINTKEVLKAGAKVTLKTDTEFIVDWAFDAADKTGVKEDAKGVTVDYLVRIGSLQECFNADIGECTRFGEYRSGSEEAGWKFICNGMEYLVTKAEDGFIRAKVTNNPSYWKHPTFFGAVTVPVKLSAVKEIAVAYRYEPAGEAKLAGQHMNLRIKARSVDGLSTVTLKATSKEAIEPGAGKVAHFTFIAPADNDNLIESIDFKFYDVDARMYRPKNLSAANFGKDNAICFGPVTFLR